MTEIPEHLLKRSRERRSAIGKGGDNAASDASADSGSGAATPATTTPAAPAAAPAPTGPAPRTAAPEPAAPEPPKPDPVYVQAAKQRRKIPWWAMATLSLMPVWGFMYWRALTETTETAEGPIGLGAEIYASNCASCHGGGGEGGVGYAFTGGEILLSYPNIEDQLRYVYYGTSQYNLAEVDIPGNPDRPGGPHVTGELGVMPGFAGQITDYQLLGAVCHERYTLGGADPSDEEFAEEFEQFCSEESPIFAALQAGEISLDMDSLEPFLGADGEEFTIDPVGSAPIEGGGP